MRVGNHLWSIRRYDSGGVGAIHVGDENLDPPIAGLWFERDDGEMRHLPMADAPTDAELHAMSDEQIEREFFAYGEPKPF